ncbi:MAG: MotA/TolQ/ExbB proton channel family protein [Myxococcales bacterium]|nr:MotA/TolQ/ExbB proton channel family protein [Myxococcales bacterium]
MMLAKAMLNFALLGAWWVLWLLVILSFICLAIGIERVVYFVVNRSPAGPFEAAVGRYLSGGGRDELEASLDQQKGVESRVLLAGLRARVSAASQHAMQGTILFERLRLERGLLVVGTVASTAAFIGLFGTVLGIIQAFHELSLESTDSGKMVMGAISEALVSTAVALMVAIPAVVLYNFLTRMVRAQLSRIESLAELVVARMRAEDA